MYPVLNPPTGDYLMIPGLALAAVALAALGIFATRKSSKKGRHSAVASKDDERSGGGGAA